MTTHSCRELPCPICRKPGLGWLKFEPALAAPVGTVFDASPPLRLAEKAADGWARLETVESR